MARSLGITEMPHAGFPLRSARSAERAAPVPDEYPSGSGRNGMRKSQRDKASLRKASPPTHRMPYGASLSFAATTLPSSRRPNEVSQRRMGVRSGPPGELRAAPASSVLVPLVTDARLRCRFSPTVSELRPRSWLSGDHLACRMRIAAGRAIVRHIWKLTRRERSLWVSQHLAAGHGTSTITSPPTGRQPRPLSPPPRVNGEHEGPDD